MITYIERFPETLTGILSDTALVKIKSLARAYGFNCPFLDFWQQDNSALIARFYGEFIIAASESSNFAEISEFFCMLCAKEVFCSLKTATALNYKNYKKYNELSLFEKLADSSNSTENDFKKIYNKLLAGTDGDICLPSFDDWYVDFSHRIRHKTARVFCLEKAVAITAFETDDKALITGVAVNKLFRGQGLGRRVLHGICSKIEADDKTPMVLANDDLTAFYIKHDFCITSQMAICTIQ
ncbi:MAG: GNAT family N-acetyltransferase [Oscillospiraceae bacterium]